MSGRLSLAVALCVLACACSRAPAPRPPVVAPTAPAAPSLGKVRLFPAPAYPDAAVVIADRKVQTEAEHRHLLVYVGAPWCEPCQRFHAAAEKGELDTQLPDLDLIVFDSENDRDRLRAAGYVSKFIPLFVVPASDGRASAQMTEGGLKGERAVGQLVPRLQGLITGS